VIGMDGVPNLRQLRDDLDRGLAPPAAWYTDPAISALEVERIFRRSWQYVGRLGQLGCIGDYFTGTVGDIPIVVVRTADGICALVNICRHRRHAVAQGAGNRQSLQCPYHAWRYELDGRLRTAPRSERESGFCKEEYPLLALQVATWGPWIFANADPAAPPFPEVLGDVPRVIAAGGLDVDSLQLRRREEWTFDANWKVMMENFLECYHCPVQHPAFCAAVDVRPEAYQLTADRWSSTQRAAAREVPTGSDLREVQYHLLWPNLTLCINPGPPNLVLDVWLPDGPDRTTGFSEHYFGPNVPAEVVEEIIAFNAQVSAEDEPLMSSVQRNLRCGIPDRGRFLVDPEQLCIHFQKLVLGALNGDQHG
jgi:choline monooxygenase